MAMKSRADVIIFILATVVLSGNLQAQAVADPPVVPTSPVPAAVQPAPAQVSPGTTTTAPSPVTGAPEVSGAPSDPVSDSFPVMDDSLLSGWKPPVPGESPVVTVEEPPMEKKDTRGIGQRIRESFGSDRTIINMLVLAALFVIFLFYRIRSGRNRRS